MEKYKRFLFFLALILKIFPRKKIVLFRSFHGQYNDNPKYISKALFEMDSAIKQVWAISKEANKKDIPSYIKIVNYNSIKYYYYIFRSKIIVDNYLGIFYSFCKKKSNFYNFIKNDKKQLNISTWHGTPLKKIGKYQDEINNKFFYTSSDIVPANSEYVKKTLEDSFYIDNVRLLGTPRNDALFCEYELKELKEKLGLPLNKKIILFAPTFRESLFESGERQLKEINYNKLFDSFKQKFGGEWVLVARVHNEVLSKFDFTELNKNNIINGNEHDDMAEYLVASDALITDYSSSLFDYLYTKKPCFLFALDKENYENKERGLYMDMKELPYSLATNVEELYDNILNYDQNKCEKNINYFLNKIGSVEDGKSSERIVNIIYNYYHYNKMKGDNKNETTFGQVE